MEDQQHKEQRSGEPERVKEGNRVTRRQKSRYRDQNNEGDPAAIFRIHLHQVGASWGGSA